TAVLSYLQAGGNALLMTRQGDSFLDSSLRSYLGVSFVTSQTIYNCTSVRAPLTDIPRIGTQNYSPLFSMALSQPTSELLYIDTSYNPDRGVGVWRAPAEGGTHNPDGGRFAFLSGRPYRWAHAALAANVETIVNDLFGQAAAAPDPAPAGARPAALRAANPARGDSRLSLSLARAAEVDLGVYDLQGRLVRRLLAGPLQAGSHALAWDGRADDGGLLPPGVYFARLRAPEGAAATPLLRLR
ncbi:MAG: hypothetical protein FJY75_07350, partial [Candidatus Eisenbacteria bacterium]|nr:hypothetical protein [Candidatus Eisenbacteria bacterium]